MVAQGFALEAPAPNLAQWRCEDVNITLLRKEALLASQGLSRVHLEIRLPRPAWGALNVTGPVVAWSFAEEPPQVRLLVKGTLQQQLSAAFAPVMHQQAQAMHMPVWVEALNTDAIEWLAVFLRYVSCVGIQI